MPLKNKAWHRFFRRPVFLSLPPLLLTPVEKVVKSKIRELPLDRLLCLIYLTGMIVKHFRDDHKME